MNIHKSAGLGSEYVVYDSDTRAPIDGDVLIVVPGNDAESVETLRYLGFKPWADRIEHDMREMKDSEGIK